MIIPTHNSKLKPKPVMQQALGLSLHVIALQLCRVRKCSESEPSATVVSEHRYGIPDRKDRLACKLSWALQS